jgi:hypothetical protein
MCVGRTRNIKWALMYVGQVRSLRNITTYVHQVPEPRLSFGLQILSSQTPSFSPGARPFGLPDPCTHPLRSRPGARPPQPRPAPPHPSPPWHHPAPSIPTPFVSTLPVPAMAGLGLRRLGPGNLCLALFSQQMLP